MPTCPACHTASIEDSAAYCSRCGAAFGAPAPAAAHPKGRWYHNIWFVLAMLLFVLGPFGLPLVWGNPKLRPWAKLALTALTLVYTAAMLDVTMRMVNAVRQAADQFNSTLQY